MAILIDPPIDPAPEPDIRMPYADAELIKRIALAVGKIEAIKVARWATKASLKTSKDFVEALCAESA